MAEATVESPDPSLMAALQRRMSMVRRDEGPLSMLLLCIDRFDRLDRPTGDRVVAQVAEIIRGYSVTLHVEVAGRPGELAIVLSGFGLYDAEYFAETICKAIEVHRFDPDGRSITVSLGVAALGDSSTLGDAVLEVTERLRRSQRRGGNCITSRAVTDECVVFRPRRPGARAAAGSDVEPSNREVSRQASGIDGLTQVFDEPRFMLELAREVLRAHFRRRPLALVLIDIDGFASCNGAHGHCAGDHVLRDLAAVVGECSRKVGAVARSGGDELAVVLPNVDLDGAAAFAETIRKKVERTWFNHDGRHLPQTVSVGAAELLPSHADAHGLRELAVQRLRRAKRLGRNRVVCDGDAEPSEATNDTSAGRNRAPRSPRGESKSR